MNRKKISRREALGVISKTGAALGIGTSFFLSLKTSPLAGSAFEGISNAEPGRAQSQKSKTAPRAAEKVLVSGSGSNLIVKVSGPAGRHCVVCYAVNDARESYKPFPDSYGIIGADGVCTLKLDTRKLPNQKVFIRVGTGKTDAFDEDISGTEAFIVHIYGGNIARFEGVLNRPLVGAGAMSIGSPPPSAMAPGVGRKRR